ncbi:hypothetical protein PMIN01_06649 [Paraphaeosphaeria minitans]|uniref:Uncharacterized protein n=1 Tax=Paraphaeosphaeria minitans TaxID=565426 RepID=A0A9P6GJD0_9PLEO|nr:hypothetical protein PMIN01_06649 [Paraphaeosphaeria minitans]
MVHVTSPRLHVHVDGAVLKTSPAGDGLITFVEAAQVDTMAWGFHCGRDSPVGRTFSQSTCTPSTVQETKPKTADMRPKLAMLVFYDQRSPPSPERFYASAAGVLVHVNAMQFRTSRMRESYRSLRDTYADVAIGVLSERWHAHVQFAVAARAGGEGRWWGS